MEDAIFVALFKSKRDFVPPHRLKIHKAYQNQLISIFKNAEERLSSEVPN